MAKAGIPILFIAGSLDGNTNDQKLVAQKRYRQLGGKITVIIKKGEGYYIQQDDPKPAVDFISMCIK